MEPEYIARIARALGHPTRIRILRLLAEQDECCGKELFSELPLPQSTVSQHLAVLKSAGLIQSKPNGTSQVYCVKSCVLMEAIAAMTDIIDGHPEFAREEA
ncbi:MAG TPA: metalloregulator ArsR/SmtB family transcription factor [Coriobacteriia bacterium]|nr:metalloregulator ArsR/SmtB family transcription factor [Coriobacteriia bacterium]